MLTLSEERKFHLVRGNESSSSQQNELRAITYPDDILQLFML